MGAPEMITAREFEARMGGMDSKLDLILDGQKQQNEIMVDFASRLGTVEATTRKVQTQVEDAPKAKGWTETVRLLVSAIVAGVTGAIAGSK